MEIDKFSNFYRGKRVLITGDTGFKGSWLALWLLELGAEVYGYALPPEREDDNYVICQVDQPINHTNGDIRDLASLVKAFNDTKPEIVFHLAAQPLVLESYKNPHKTFTTNVIGSVNFFEAVRRTPSVKVAINVTSDKCYHNNEWVWGYRETDPIGGKDPYSASKGASEIITASYQSSFFSDQDTANIASARAGNVIGAGDWSENRIVPDYFRATKTNTPLIIRNPIATRPWQHVLEPLGGYLLLAYKLYQDGKTFQGAWNFGPLDGMNRKVETLIEEMAKQTPSPRYVFEKPQDQREAHLLQLDIAKALNQLHWRPVMDFAETVKCTVSGYLSDLAGNAALEDRLQTIRSYCKTALNQKTPGSIISKISHQPSIQ